MTRISTLLALALALTACRKEEPVDLDGDGASPPEDCDDLNAAAKPGAEELCDGIDNNCDGSVDEEAVDAPSFFADTDGDGFGDAASAVSACAAPEGYVADDRDCDDSAALVHPGAAEADCSDSTDYNCDGSVGYADADGDGHAACEDCDDSASLRFPGNPEICDDLDNDCDGSVDEEATDAATFFADYDGDGYGNAEVTELACEVPEGYTDQAGDCDDLAASAYPGGAEVCDHRDNDCDGTADIGASDATAWYPDQDGDRFGDGAQAVTACEAPQDYLAAAGDCDDADASAHPGGTEVCDGADDDCDGTVDEDAADRTLSYADADGDGYGDPTSGLLACETAPGRVTVAQDCDDTAANRFPGNTETCDHRDNDCDGAVDDSPIDQVLYYADADRDGYGTGALQRACEAPEASVDRGGDCDDSAPLRFPGNPEVCDLVDNDCDGAVDDAASDAAIWYRDLDHDGFAGDIMSVQACEAPAGWQATATDCDDVDRSIHPDAQERCNGADDDCDGDTDEDSAVDAPSWYADTDGDGWGDASEMRPACAAPVGYVFDFTDCNDASSSIFPGAPEVCNLIDEDCSGTADDGLPDTDANGWEDCREVAVIATWGFQASGVTGTCDGVTYLRRELNEVREQAESLGLHVTEVMDTAPSGAGLSYSNLSKYRVIIYHNGGWSAIGAQTTLTSLQSAAAAGQGLIFLGDDMTSHAQGYQNSYANHGMLDLMHYASANGTLPGARAIVEEPLHPVMNGEFGAVGAFTYLADMDRGLPSFTGEEVLMLQEGSDYPAVMAVESGDHRMSLAVTSLYNSHHCPISDEDGLAQIEKWFLNSLAWMYAE